MFDYHTFTPGPKCFTQEELQQALFSFLVKAEDSYKEERERVAQTAYKYRDGSSSQRIWKDLRQRFLTL